ncbi:MBL fold metallo-hydrolase [Natrialbaceae archaeon A-gly3]
MQRIALKNTVFEGKNNAYLFDGESTVLIDPGVSVKQTRTDLKSALTAYGVEFADIDAILLTHYHADHSGLAGEIQAVSGATVHAHAADAPLIAGDEDAWDDVHDRHRQLFDEWGMPEEKQSELFSYWNSSDEGYGASVNVDAFEDAEQLTFGGHTFDVLHTPGHTAGLSCFVIDDGAQVLSGDALLPKYTPNVGGADVRVERPLEKYLWTLERIIDREFDRAWPGHRDPIDDPSGRARNIRDHHEERSWRVLSVLTEHGPMDAWTVSAHLFGGLSDIHILHGPGEAYAHLEHLVSTGDVERDAEGYRVAPDAAERFSTRDDHSWPLET